MKAPNSFLDSLLSKLRLPVSFERQVNDDLAYEFGGCNSNCVPMRNPGNIVAPLRRQPLLSPIAAVEARYRKEI
jgi:hypothetical protein